MRKVARSGGDPVAERKQKTAPIPTFEQATQIVLESRRPTWRNEKHASQWINTLRSYAFPEIGSMRVDVVTTPDVLRVLAPIWLTKPETARRVRQRVATVFDWAKAAGFRSDENPVVGVDLGLPRQGKQKKHFQALPFIELPGFLKQLHASDADVATKLAFEFLVLTAARTSEVLNARWDEIDEEAGVWVVPAQRMKAKREHRVPLGRRCKEILHRARLIGCSSAYVFSGRSIDRPISNMALLMLLRRTNVPATTHGFRSTFSDWAAERTHHPREVVEMALAHTIQNRVEAAYRRGDLYEKRRQLMDDWEAFALSSTDSAVNQLRGEDGS